MAKSEVFELMGVRGAKNGEPDKTMWVSARQQEGGILVHALDRVILTPVAAKQFANQILELVRQTEAA